MVFVCLGWGSLTWCQKRLPITGAWQADGPELPIEFARESRDKRITLVICDHAPPVRVLWAALDVSTLDEAIRALAMREGVRDANIQHSIGYWSPASVSNRAAAEPVREWALGRGFEGVVWTALRPRIGEDSRIPTQDEIIDHLAALRGAAQDTAEEYVRLAPRQIATPYRRAIERAFGWTPLGLL